MTRPFGWLRARALVLLAAAIPHTVCAQDARVRDLVLADAAPPSRLMGYGLVTGLSGTGDRVSGTYGSRQTVQSVVNLLRRFDVEVPPELLRTRNVAAVVVTAEVSPYLRPGGRFDVQVSSVGDAQTLRGGVLWMTPLVADAGGKALAGAQGVLLMSGSTAPGAWTQGGTTARIPGGGVLEVELPRPSAGTGDKLLLREPDVGTATRIVAAIDSAFGGAGNASVDDPGAISLTIKDTSASLTGALARIRELRVRPARAGRIVIDGRDGTVVAGGDLLVGEAVVSHEGITLSVGVAADSTSSRGDVRVAAGSTAQSVAVALHAMQSSASETAAIFEALRTVGAISAEVVVR